MSELVAPRKSRTQRLTQAAALVVVFAVLFAATRLVPESRSVVGTVAGLGFLLLAGTLTSELTETIGLPHLSGYLLAGIVAGPHVFKLIDSDTVEGLSPVNTLALALIALAGGSELHLSSLKAGFRSIAITIVFQALLTMSVATAMFFFLSRYIHFSMPLTAGMTLGIALLWGALSTPRSPSAMMGILAQTRAKGPLATFSLTTVMLTDAVVILLIAVVIVFVRPLLEPGAGLTLTDLSQLGHELIGSVALGVTLGLLLSAYLRVVGTQLLFVLLAVGVGLSELLRYLEFDALLAFLVAGFVVQNFSNQGQKLLEAIQRSGTAVFVIFFGLAGAHLDVPILVKLWPVALALCASRGAATYVAGRMSARVANDSPLISRWGWSGLISQAGLTLGLSIVVLRAFPVLGETFRSLAIAAVAINEMIGPILFKLALDRSGESRSRNVGATPVIDDATG